MNTYKRYQHIRLYVLNCDKKMEFAGEFKFEIMMIVRSQGAHYNQVRETARGRSDDQMDVLIRWFTRYGQTDVTCRFTAEEML